MVETKLTIRNVIEQLDTQLARRARGLALLRAGAELSRTRCPRPSGRGCAPPISRSIRDGIFPAYRRLRDFLQNEYLPRARDGVGLVHDAAAATGSTRA